MHALLFGLLLQASPYTLSIGNPGSVTVSLDQIVSTSTSRPVTVSDIAKAAEGKQFVYLGESHNNPDHHKMQAAVIAELVKQGREVIVGFEMFTRPAQINLNPWTLGWWDEATFIEQSNWKKEWGFDYALYRPIFETIKANRLPMVALNVPRDWVRAVGKGGYAALTPEWKKELPDPLFLGNDKHKEIFAAMMGGHPMTGTAGENIYAAQVLWDEGMADTAIKYMNSHMVSPKTVFVVVAGAGHVMYGQGINYRVGLHTKMTGVTLTMVDGTEPLTVSRGLGDFVYMAKPGAE